MSCRRICRELLWLARFGEFGPSSAPHLDHLAHCRTCRDEVGFDRALVQQLRTALAERIEQADPSPAAWDVIRERAQSPERGLRSFLHVQATALAARLRTATAITAVALAGIIATSTQVAITHPDALPTDTAALAAGAPGEQFERQLFPRAPHAALRVPVVYVVTATPSDPEAVFLVNASLTGTGSFTPIGAQAAGTEELASAIDAVISFGEPVSRFTPADPATGESAPPAALTGDPLEPESAGTPY